MYEAYIRSFADGNGDGVGDLAGVAERLPYLEWLGVDHLWLTPFFWSPMKDFGYDIADYLGVYSLFGTMAHFDAVVAEATRRKIGVIIDAVLNHTSNEHPWFIASRASRRGPKANWYVWRDPAPDGGPPNNWISVFGGSAWTYEPKRRQYYLHSFLPEQPDLNWENPEVQRAMQEVLRFWFRRGVMGIRVDAWDWAGKDYAHFADDPVNPLYNPRTDSDPYHRLLHHNSTRGPKLREYLQKLEAVALEFPGRFIVTESFLRGEGNLRGEVRELFDRHNPGISAPFNFGLMRLPHFNARMIGGYMDTVQSALRPGETLINVLGNHDSRRLASRYGEAMVRAAAVLLLTLPGIAVIYQGDELGLVDGVILPEQVRDPAAKQHPTLGRDPGRTPMPWTHSRPRAGFTTGRPWLPITQPQEMSVDLQRQTRRSTLHLYQALIALRRSEPALRKGLYERLDVRHPGVLAYTLSYHDSQIAVFLNLSGTELTCGTSLGRGELLLSTGLDIAGGRLNLRSVRLRPGEGWVVRV